MPSMVKSKASNKGENEDIENIEVERMSSRIEPQTVGKVVQININTIENIVRQDSLTVTILVYHNETLLGESQPLRIDPDFREPPPSHQIDYLTQFPINVADRREIDAAISTPLLIKVIEHPLIDVKIQAISSAAGDNKKSRSKSGAKSAETAGPQMLGLCNLDLIPMLLGEKTVTERLIVEKTDNSATSWMNLPVLTVTLTQDEGDFFPSDLEINYLSVTVESIHNPTAAFAQNLEYQAATIIYIDGEDPQTLFFDGGKFSKYRDVEKTKRWRTLNKLEGRAKLSKYKIDRDYGNTKNTLENLIDVKEHFEKNNPRIEWNCLSRHILFSPGQEAMKDNINKYKYWPFQFMTSSNVSEGGKTKSKDYRPQLYQCYADISELLYPGRTQTRTIAQLYPFNSPDMLDKTGFDKLLFTSGPVTESKQKEKKGKLSAKGDSSIHSLIMRMESEAISTSPLTNEKGEPVFVVIEFELKEPLILARTSEELTGELHELVGPPVRLPFYPYTADLPEEQYLNCIRKLVETITESYRDFSQESEIAKEFSNSNRPFRSEESTGSGRYPYIPDEIDRFTQYLYDTGTYMAVQSSLKKKITRLLDQKFKIQSCTWNSEECQNLITTAYVYLVEQMHAAIQSASEQCEDKSACKANNLCYSAEETYELGNISQAKNIYLSLIAVKRKDPDAWLKYAIFSMKIKDEDRSVECCREAIILNPRHKLALLLYGVILTVRKEYQAAETFLKIVTQLYPRFAEGWAILHLFYLRIEYYPGVDLTIRVAEQCLMDPDRDTVHIDCFEKEPLAWSTIHCPKDRVYLIVIVLLLRLNLLDFAGIALGRELTLTGRSTSWLYYMAVHHYLQDRFDDALTHLKEAQYQHGIDYSISGLMGHCHFKEGNSKEALECYEFASTLFNRPPDIHLIHIRLGNYYLDNEEYGKARKIFLDVCKTSPTSNSWLGLGIACYNIMNLKDAETAFTEANRLDHTDPEVWGYLCLLNMSLHRHDEFTECYRQMVKNDLQNAKLWLLITNTMESLGLSSPMLLSAVSGDTIVKDKIIKESSEESDAEFEETTKSLLKSEFNI